jgi:hypothetical protein
MTLLRIAKGIGFSVHARFAMSTTEHVAAAVYLVLILLWIMLAALKLYDRPHSGCGALTIGTSVGSCDETRGVPERED